MSENEISYQVRSCIFKVYNNIGPGLLESAYEAALTHELTKIKLSVNRQVPVPMFYDSVKIDIGYRLDILVENKVIIEIKSVEQIAEVHHKQIITYLKLANKKLGILVNFNSENIAQSIYRKANGL